MGTKHQSSSDSIPDSKKKRRVGFSKIDPGVEANECIQIYLVSRKEEVDSPDSFLLKPVDLNNFFEDDGKIYGYQSLKITIWISTISFHAYADISFESVSDGGKGITDLKSSLQNIFAETLVEDKDSFLQTFSAESHFAKSITSSGKILQHKSSDGRGIVSVPVKAEPSDVQVFRIVGESIGFLYSRLVPLVLLLVDGSNPIDIMDSGWEIYLLVQKKVPDQENPTLIGFAATYRFLRYPDSTRLRLGQILILPPYQRQGYGRYLLEVLHDVAVSENVYDLTVEEPEDSLQYVRTCIDIQHLLAFDPIQEALNSVVLRLQQENPSKKIHACGYGPPSSAIEEVRRSLKINKKQFLQCWEVLIYLRLDPIDKHMQTFRTIISNKIKSDVIGKEAEGARKRVVEVPTDYDQEMSFVMFKSSTDECTSMELDQNQDTKEEALKQLVDERIKEVKLIAEKVSLPRP